MHLILWILVLNVMSFVMGSVTKSGVHDWYQTLNRAPLTPPDHVFGLVWSLLYTMIAISGWLIWETKCDSRTPFIKRLYVAQLLLNWIWSPLFFGLHWTGAALVCLGMIIVLVTILILKVYRKGVVAALLLVPYLMWLLFAGYLNFYIWQYNAVHF